MNPSLKFTWSISDEQLPFLDLVLEPTSDRLVTSIHYKPTDTHSYLNYASSHSTRCKDAFSFSAYGASAVARLILKNRAKKWLFCSDAVATRNGLLLLVTPSPPPKALISEPDEIPADQPGTIPVILTYHPTNVQVKNIITRNLHLVRDDPETTAILKPLRILCAYRRDSNLRDPLVRECH